MKGQSLKIYVILYLVFLYAPIVLLPLFAFNSGTVIAFPLQGFTFGWFIEVFTTQLKKQITIRLDEDSIGYFKGISADVGIPYQSLINLYLRDCVAQNRKLDLRWK